MKKFLCLLPLVAALVSGCEYQKSPRLVEPSPLSETPAPTEPPPVTTYPSTGPEIVAYVSAKYPEKLAAGVSREERVANMQFLRDRVIEVGKCGGLDLGWNLKRGGPEISVDFIAERVNGDVHGRDIALDYDNTGSELRLQWIGGTHPYYREYPNPECR